ncbi:MAG: malonyl-ACP O-methyltransferase BioC [gamma proteobacterium symbiont of Bathyaustriella thionipta]|nr:malonyl-ACP O-methyltransferase BioC [gamma proteobacterium symbiont of Bathyaustriella thionipta]MCU7949133.1 malonyl-ACP O-methyltransferase BioC [gamma proteobacterium symbiont of Bathyaustriella thionipta]MCU7952248.1 malonyl-ACP O-methyltransferase BioC [gamma proteobacterium symbiont of Bathyaustriella thionipta]MCU7955798.1 malonyl-ACP O-methyltransferase BioC [gamma proteobacterium symbiont of Bathyaustriella thionipta]MCU7968034.1 malonyl-ACP O-methyltransferase BioC [gamma proteoba
MTNVLPQPFTKQQVRDSFNKAAETYDTFAIVQREVCERLLERLDYIKVEPQIILDIGAGTGQGSQGLALQYPDARIISMDLAENMLLKNRDKMQLQSSIADKVKNLFKSKQAHQFVCADAEQLPFADASMDMIFSSLTIQWCSDLTTLFNEFRRVLKPGGLLMFTTLGTQTLHELRASWAAVSDKVHVNQFADMLDIGDALYHAQVENPVMDNETIVLNYQTIKQILIELKAVGAHNQNIGREKALTGKNRLKAMYKAYEKFRTGDGFPVTYEVLYGHAWNPATPMQTTQSGPNEQQTSISLAQLKSTLGSRER